tara:strand:- start:36 stop:1772 length:1737 start_codon:yes stop_codon:yes gene_type:complete
MALTQLKTNAIADDAVTTDKLANAINTERTANTAKVSLTDDSVTSAKIADDAVVTAAIADDAITSALIADDAIVSAAIADDAVTLALVADESVDEARLQISNIGSNGHVLTKQSGDTGGLTWAAPAVTFDDNNIVNDISNLALKISNLENSTRYNTNSTFVDTFQDSNGVATFTTCERNTSGEYIDSTQQTNVTFDFANSSSSDAHRHPPIIPVCDWSSNGTSSWGTGDSWANDRFLGNNNDGGNDNIALPNFAFDCAGDFEHYCHNYVVHDNYGYRGNMGGQALVIVVVKNTSATAGKNPQYSGAGALRGGPISGFNGHPDDLSASNLDNYIFSDAYATHVSAGNFTEYRWTGSTAQTQDVSGANAAGFMAKFFFNTSSGSGADNGNTAHGLKVVYDVSDNELEAGFLNSSGGDGYHKKITLTNMPTSGRIYCISGFDSDSAGAHTGYTSLSHNSSDESSGTIVSSAIGATGNFVSNAITAPSTITKMGAVITYKDQAGTNTLNTDLKLYLSSDNGSNWTAATLVALPDYASGVKQCAVNDLTIATAQGTALKYKVEFANQAAGSKECRVTGIALQY